MSEDLTAERLAELDALAEKATPGKRYQLSGKYMAFDLGETPQVFRATTDMDEELIIACDPDTIRALVKMARRALASDLEHKAHCLEMNDTTNDYASAVYLRESARRLREASGDE